MEPKLENEALVSHQKTLQELRSELEKLNSKVENNEGLSLEDTKFLGELGWFSALSVSIAAIATNI